MHFRCHILSLPLKTGVFGAHLNIQKHSAGNSAYMHRRAHIMCLDKLSYLRDSLLFVVTNYR